MLHPTSATRVFGVRGTKKDLDAGVEWCKSILVEVLGEEEGAAAFHFLPALQGLIWFKNRDREALVAWANAWRDSLQ
jgi:hypothetical protein